MGNIVSTDGSQKSDTRPSDACFTPAIEKIWRENRCLTDDVIGLYRRCVKRFVNYCRAKQLSATSELTLEGVKAYARWHSRTRKIRYEHALANLRSALAAWAFARRMLGDALPLWQPIRDPFQGLPPVIYEFIEHQRQIRGIQESTIRIKIIHLRPFIAFLRSRHRSLVDLRPRDIDDFIIRASKRYKPATVCYVCSVLRGFARFLRVTGRHPSDIAASIQAPRLIEVAKPYRALPWHDVQQVLRAVNRSTPQGQRNYAILLMMSAYGLGAGEIIRLTLDSIDWHAGTIHVVRPKTGVDYMLPLIPGVARALASYLRDGRPVHAPTRHLFVTLKVPYKRISVAVVIQRILRKYAKMAGVAAPFLGTHALRHAHACRQMELGTRPKLIGDILGHRSPRSTTAYLRASTKHLRQVALRVPT